MIYYTITAMLQVYDYNYITMKLQLYYQLYHHQLLVASLSRWPLSAEDGHNISLHVYSHIYIYI